MFADRFEEAKTIAEKTALATGMMDAAGKVRAGSADQHVLLMTLETETFAPKEGQMFVADLSGSGNHGIVEGAKLIPAGRAGAVLLFAGKVSIVLPTVATQLTQGLRQLSISAWVMPAIEQTRRRFDHAKLALAIRRSPRA